MKEEKRPNQHSLQEHLHFIEHCRPMFISLLGDKHGWIAPAFPDFPYYDELLALPDAKRMPISLLETYCGSLLHPTKTVSLYYLRKGSQYMNIPEGVMQAMTDNYTYYHPDPEGNVVVEAPPFGKAPAAAGLPVATINNDPQILMKRWEVFRKLKETVRESVHPLLIFDGYNAQFSKVDTDGNILLTKLQLFEKAFGSDLWHVLNYYYPPPPPPKPPVLEEAPDEVINSYAISPTASSNTYAWKSAHMYYDERRSFYANLPTKMIGRKTALARLDLYLVSPTSRNILLVTAPRGAGTTTLLATFIKKTMGRASFVVCSHFVGNSALSDDPKDIRTVLLSLCKQMLPEGSQLPASVLNSIDIHALKQYWYLTLKTTAANLKEGKVLMLVVDGLDQLAKYPAPTDDALRGASGVDRLAGDRDLSDVGTPFDWIPMALQRNVRLIASMDEKSKAAIRSLEERGQDACEVYALDELNRPDSEEVAKEYLSTIRTELTSGELDMLMAKSHSRVPQYVKVVCDLLEHNAHRIQYEKQYTFLERLPDTQAGLCEMALDAAEQEVDPELLRRMVGLLLCSRNGLLELELRELLLYRPVGQRVANPDGAPSILSSGDFKPLLSGEKWAKLYSVLRPFLCTYLRGIPAEAEEEGIPSVDNAPLNGTNCLLEFNNQSFIAVAKQRYLPTFEKERDFHMQLARYYRSKSEQWLHPLVLKGVKEFAYHMTKSRMWSTLMQSAFTIHFVKKAYTHQIGYSMFRDCLQALLEMHEYFTLKAHEDPAFAQSQSMQFESWLEHMREYIDFIHSNNTALASHPSLSIQQAFNSPTDTNVYSEAKEYYQNNPEIPHFLWLNKHIFRCHEGKITTAVFSPHALRFMTASTDHSVKVCNLLGETLFILAHQMDAVSFALYSQTSKYIVTICKDRTCSVYDATTGQHLCKLADHLAEVRCCAISARGRFIGTGSDDRTLKIWLSETGACVTSISHVTYCPASSPFQAVACVAGHPHYEERWLSACDRTVLVWELQRDNSVECLRTITAHTLYPVFSAKWSPEGNTIMTCARIPTENKPQSSTLPQQDTMIKLWSFLSGRLLSRLVGSPTSTPIHDLCVSYCNNYVGVACDNGTAIVWKTDWQNTHTEGASPDNATTAKQILPIAVFQSTSSVACCCFSHDSKYLAICAGNLVQVCRIEDPVVLIEFMCVNTLTYIHWSPTPSKEGGHIIAGDEGGCAYLLQCIRLPNDPLTAPSDSQSVTTRSTWLQ
eukprot:TRINITY_DN67663_c2_g3_i1.p1 TRINITY_DN67663_c2_g3~~TRINITY_DN67663_c2_g3_i1.p1  ORF type:complete len:1254 (+),score=99.73 TRINITY_DN67663_c2_g3_i1:29-3763(+)